MSLGFIIILNPYLWWQIYSAALWAAMPQILTTAALIGASIGLNYLLRPKPPHAGSTALDRTAFPTIAEGTPYVVIFGTVRIDGYDAEWMGNTYVYERKRSDVVVYRYYYAGVHFIYCRGPVDGLKQLWYGDAGGGKCAWPTPLDPTVFAADGETTAVINATLYGGPYDGGQGPVAGTLSIMLGATTQLQNAYLVSQLGSDIPAFRGMASLAGWVNWGCLPTPLILAGIWKRVLIQDDGTARWYVAKAPINTYDLNAVHILRECFTNSDWGEGMSSSQLGDTWTTVADTAYTEGFGLSCQFTPEPGNLKDLIDSILEVLDAEIYDDPLTSKLEIILNREGYDIDDLPAFSEADFVISDFARPTWRDIPGRVTLAYTDRLHPDAGATAPPYIDNVIIAKQGRTVERVLNYPMICNDTLAATVVARKGRAMTAMMAALNLSCKRTMLALHKGSLFRLSYDDASLAITQMVVRVVSVNYGGSQNEQIEMVVAEDPYGQAYTIMGAKPGTEWTEPSAGSGIGTESPSPTSSPSSSISTSPSSSVSASASEGTPSASISASASEGTPSASPSASPSSSASKAG